MNLKSLRLSVTALALFLLGSLPGNLIAASGGPSEADVKAAFHKAYTHRDADESTITFDGPIEIGSPVAGQKAPYLGKEAFPVKVDFTVAWIYKSGEARVERTHRKGGVFLFYRDSSGGWSFDVATLPSQSSETTKGQ